MPRHPRTDLAIRRIRRIAACVAHGRGIHTRRLPELLFRAPEAPHAEERLLEAGGKRRHDTAAVHEVRPENRHRFGAARQCLIGIGESELERAEESHTLILMPESPRRIHFVADRGDARLRLDRVLVRRVVDVSRMSRSRAQEWIETGLVLVDGSPVARPAIHVREGAAIEIALPDSTELRLRPEAENRALEVLYEDEHLIAINKPPGLVVHPSYKNPSGTLLNALLGRFGDRPSLRPGIVT